MTRVLIIPGNGCSGPSIRGSNFYGSLAAKLEASGLFTEVIAEPLPDPNAARRSIWIPHIINKLKVDAETIVIGHSSGAEACLRLIETEKVKGCVLVSACHTDLGDEGERDSGWYPPGGGAWKWEEMKANAGWVIQFHSKDDPFIGVAEARHVSESIESEYHEYTDKSHFFDSEDSTVIFDEVVKKC